MALHLANILDGEKNLKDDLTGTERELKGN